MAKLTKANLDSLAPVVSLPEKSNRGRKARIIPELAEFVSAWGMVKVGEARLVPTAVPNMSDSDMANLRHHLDRYFSAAGIEKKVNYTTRKTTDSSLAIVKVK